jgi:hypothetical protein
MREERKSSRLQAEVVDGSPSWVIKYPKPVAGGSRL